MPSLSPRVSRRFSTRVDAQSTDELTHEVKKDATVESITVRFYPGAELDLQVRPFVEPDEGNRISPVSLIGREVIVGDDDVFEFHVTEPVEEEDIIGVEFDNVGDYDLDGIVDMTLDREGGIERIVGNVRGWI